MIDDLQGKTALVTGASSGIGRAASVALAAAGANVVLAARRREPSEALVAEIEAAGGRALYVPTDVANADDVVALVERTLETFGALDLAFNNAGVGSGAASLHEMSEEQWDRTMDVNVKGVWLCMRSQLNVMLERGGGVILNNASVAGVLTGDVGAYGASKAAVISLSRSAAKRYGPDGIRVNALCPGYVDTEMTERLQEEERRQRAIDMTPQRRIAAADEMARSVLWLLSDASAYLTGQAVVVDGGIGLYP